MFHTPPDYSFLRTFGCLCYPWLRPYTKHKLQPQSIPCVFIRYHPSVKGYRCLDPVSGKIYLSRHVVFDEQCFPFSSTPISSSAPSVAQLHSFFWSSLSSSMSHSPSSSVSSMPATAAPTESISAPPVSPSAPPGPTSSVLPLRSSSLSHSIPISSLHINLPLPPPTTAPVNSHSMFI